MRNERLSIVAWLTMPLMNAPVPRILPWPTSKQSLPAKLYMTIDMVEL